MGAPPSYLGGSQDRKMPLALLSLHFRFSGGSGTAAEGERQVSDAQKGRGEAGGGNRLEGSLAGEDTLTGSSMYAGSPGPHLLQAVTLNRYSFPSITSVTVCSRSRMPVATCRTRHTSDMKVQRQDRIVFVASL